MKKRRPIAATPSGESQRALIHELALAANAAPPPKDEGEIDDFLDGAESAMSDFKRVLTGEADENLKMPIGDRLHLLGLFDEMNTAWLRKRQRELLTDLARRRHDAGIGAILKEAQAARAASERAEAAAEKTAELIRALRPEWLTGEKNPPRQYLAVAGSIKMMIYALWRDYEHDPQDNGGRKADFATFYEMNGWREVRQGVTLQTFIEGQAEQDPKHRTPEQLIERIIRSEGERVRKAEKRQKPNPRQLRRK